jgi:hypothetical protein
MAAHVVSMEMLVKKFFALTILIEVIFLPSLFFFLFVIFITIFTCKLEKEKGGKELIETV